MGDLNQPIDVHPIDQSNTSANRAVKSKYFTYDEPTKQSAGTPSPPAAAPAQSVEATVVEAHVIDTDSQAGGSSTKPASGRVAGAVSLAAGGACALIGVPLLILPGPGLLMIGGGAMLIANGARKLFGQNK